MLDLSENKLSGNIPPHINQMAVLEVLDLSSNQLGGAVPEEIGQCMRLQSTKLNNNSLSGSLPGSIGNLNHLQTTLDVSHNNLSGAIPSEIGKLDMLENINLSHNQFSGSIPASIAELKSLSIFVVSYNTLEGSVPGGIHNASAAWFLHNKGLCGELVGLAPCHSTPAHHRKKGQKLLLEVGIPLLAIIICITVGVSVALNWGKKSSQGSNIVKRTEAFSIWNFDGKIAFEDIISATDNFDEKYCIGEGGYGRVYKANLPDGHVVAVKKLHHIEEELHKEEIYQYIEKGSLASILSSNGQAIQFDWQKRATLIKGLAQAICYLHHDCHPPIIHRDITSSNILLDGEYKAFISDFGTARLLKPDSSNWSALAGTYGYMLRHCGFRGADGKASGDFLNRPSFLDDIDTILEEHLDHRLPVAKIDEEDIVGLFSVALQCLQTSPQERPNMQQVYRALTLSNTTEHGREKNTVQRQCL
ncbi:hypothetical protein ACP4OV_015828 [Aristida adscensionis]